MLLGAALVPDSPLLVPGASGRGVPCDGFDELAAACAAAVRGLLRDDPVGVVVVAPGATTREHPPDGVRLVPDLGALGVPRLAALDEPDPRGRLVQGAAGTVGLHLLTAAGRREGVRLVEVSASSTSGVLHRLGRDVVGRGPVALLLAGSLSARRHDTSPLPPVAGALEADDAVLADLLAMDAPARDRLAAVTADEARRLSVTAWPVWQVLLGAADGAELTSALLWCDDPLGTSWPVLTWGRR